MGKLIATFSKGWDTGDDTRDRVRKDVARRGFVVEVVDVKEGKGDAAKVTGHELHIEIPEKTTDEDERELLLLRRLERHYVFKVRKEA